MTCHHGPNDPSCSSHPDYVDPYRKPEPTTPDAENYQIVDAQAVGKHLVLKVSYPNCRLCAYEGTKVMVFLNTSSLDALKWKRIDPHFRDEKRRSSFASQTQASSPAARFPASNEGWQDAIEYARSK